MCIFSDEVRVMPRQNVYMKQRTLNSILAIVNERREEGDTHAEANISSVCSEMLELGIRVYRSAKAKKRMRHFLSRIKFSRKS